MYCVDGKIQVFADAATILTANGDASVSAVIIVDVFPISYKDSPGCTESLHGQVPVALEGWEHPQLSTQRAPVVQKQEKSKLP